MKFTSTKFDVKKRQVIFPSGICKWPAKFVGNYDPISKVSLIHSARKRAFVNDAITISLSDVIIHIAGSSNCFKGSVKSICRSRRDQHFEETLLKL